MQLKKDWLVVADLENNVVRELLSGPDESVLTREDLSCAHERLFEKHRELTAKFPLHRYELILARAEDLQSLKTAFPEFKGWDQAPCEPV